MKKILVSPLNWGLGHATRCIPVINELINNGASVSIAGDGESLRLLKQEFPQQTFFELPSYNITYSSGDSMVFKMLANFPKIRKAITAEHDELKAIQNQNHFDIIIADNRYGMYHEETYNIFITHQINIQVPKHLKWLQPLLLNYNLKQISNFKECWIPDFEGDENLSGDLSHNCKLPGNSYYIGALSRFGSSKPEVGSLKSDSDVPGSDFRLPTSHFNLLVILSGPEPQRTIFEKIIIAQLKTSSQKTLIVQGLTNNFETKQLSENAWAVSYLTSETLFQKIKEAELIISRSGYSTIMDLAVCGKKAVLVPTPGQTEQEYLAEQFQEKNIFYSCKQPDFDLNDVIKKSETFDGLKLKNNGSMLSERIKVILKNKL
ncbi:MAG: glycosyltransferase [Bacteroidia bacterium]